MTFLFALLLASSEVLDNDAITRMVRAGLTAEVIALKIERTAGRYDVSADALIALKTSGAPDAVLKAILLKGESAPPPPPPPPQPQAVRDACTSLRYYTTGNGGWSWVPSSVCVDAAAVSVDENRIALPKLTAQCRVKALSLLGGDDGEWWLSDGTDTYKFRGATRELDAVEAALARVAPSVPRGSCSERAIRRLLR
jgi:hypothetical protein